MGLGNKQGPPKYVMVPVQRKLKYASLYPRTAASMDSILAITGFTLSSPDAGGQSLVTRFSCLLPILNPFISLALVT